MFKQTSDSYNLVYIFNGDCPLKIRAINIDVSVTMADGARNSLQALECHFFEIPPFTHWPAFVVTHLHRKPPIPLLNYASVTTHLSLLQYSLSQQLVAAGKSGKNNNNNNSNNKNNTLKMVKM